MKLHEAIKKAADDPHVWFRPISWRFIQQAYCIVDGITYRVPSLHGGVPSMTSNIDELMGEWEIITPQQLFAEFDYVQAIIASYPDSNNIIIDEEDLVDPFYWGRKVRVD